MQKIQRAGPRVRCNISFNTDANNPGDANISYANALLGNYDSYSEALQRPQSDYRFTNTEWFIQDDWKVRNGLSISYGLRFYHDPAQYDKRRFISSFPPSARDPASPPFLSRPAAA